jgi:glutathione S-transferase
MHTRYGVGASEVEPSRQKIVAALERLEAELDGRKHLVGGRFTIADLTAAALFYPLVLPPGSPWPAVPVPESWESFRAELSDRPGYRWVEETWRRHRRR